MDAAISSTCTSRRDRWRAVANGTPTVSSASVIAAISTSNSVEQVGELLSGFGRRDFGLKSDSQVFRIGESRQWRSTSTSSRFGTAEPP